MHISRWEAIIGFALESGEQLEKSEIKHTGTIVAWSEQVQGK